MQTDEKPGATTAESFEVERFAAQLPGLPDRAPWYVRRPKLAGLAAGAGVLAIVSALGAYGWQTFRLTELDRVKITVPAVPLGYPAVERPATAPPAPAVALPPPAPAPRRAEPPRVAPPAAKAARPSSHAGARPAVTHTKASQAGLAAGAVAAPPASGPANESRCAESVAALGLCGTRSEGTP